LDTIGLDVASDVTRSLSLFVDNPLPAVGLLGRMVGRGWLGKKSGRGFYHYSGGRRKKQADLSEVLPTASWPARLADKAKSLGRRSDPPTAFPIRTRLVHLLINEAARCLGEGVVNEPAMVDLAMVLGTGFAPFRGGPLRLADEVSVARVVEELEAMRQALGDRFAPCATLRQLGDHHGEFYGAAGESTPREKLESPRKADR
jgi:3-hydroxyacyl-CoA dehydrogenase/enoyl-CoA hydratase/3-hydroxybutyryl-CoA epimerase